MKRLLALASFALALASGAAQAAPVSVSVGAFGGLSIPVLQDVSASSFSPSDAFGETGTQFGIRVPVRAQAIPIFTFEPYYATSKYKDRDETIGGITYTREGFDGKSFGLNAIFGKSGGTGFFPYVGINKTKLERTGQEIDKVGYNFGVGFGISPAPKFSVQLRGEFAMVATGDTSRKFTSATVGVNYSVLP